MLTQIEKAKSKWGGSHEAIDNWLNERQDLLVQYCKIAGLPPFERDHTAMPAKETIESFCEILMDYLSAGHFEVYDLITEESDNEASAQISQEIYPKLKASTDIALSFNDTYAEVSPSQDLSDFDQHLSRLGQTMEERFALEDRLISSLHATQA